MKRLTRVILLALLLSGCGMTVRQVDLDPCIEKCKPNEGMKNVYVKIFDPDICTCNNGAEFITRAK
jgi:PBP1b-binding outer membrane lipoprotein LpoB